MNVDILGTEYKIIFDTPQEREANPKYDDCNGYAELLSKVIHVSDCSDLKDDKETMEKINLFRERVLRHEIIHAFLYESGMSEEYVRDEELVHWLSVQFPKMAAAFINAECL